MAGFIKNLAEGALSHKAELAGLGVLAAPSVDDAQAHARAALSHDYNKAGVEKRTLLPHVAKPVSELAGLGILAGPSLAHLKVGSASLLDELLKLGVISDIQAQKSIDRLDALEKSSPTAGQVGRYGAIGAGAGMAMKALGHGIEHGFKPLSGRGLLAAGLTGAVGMGATPLVRGALDRRAESGKLRQYLDQEGVKAAATLDTLQQAYRRLAPMHAGEYAKNPADPSHAPRFERTEDTKIAALGARTVLPTAGGNVPSMASPRLPSNFAQMADPSSTEHTAKWIMHAPTVARESGVNMAGGGSSLGEGAATVPPPRGVLRAPAAAPAAGALVGGARARVPFKGPAAFAATVRPTAGFTQGVGAVGRLVRPTGIVNKVVGGLAHA